MKRQMVERYIAAYNEFDVDGMVADVHDNVVFRNISGGEVNLEMTGKQAFKEQAEKAKALFLEREQKITAVEETEEQVRVSIAYRGVLAADLSPDLKAGQTLALEGKSIFTFKENKIIVIEDIS